MTGALLRRLGAAAILWWALAGGSAPRGAGAAVAAASIAGAAVVSLALRPAQGARLRLRGVPGFVAFLVGRSFMGGLDVARRALLPGGIVRPGFVEVDPDVPAGGGRALYIEVVSVMPGTLVAEEIEPGGRLRVHVIDTDMPVDHTLGAVARHIRETVVPTGHR